MELMDYLTTRRSIRRYQNRLIPKETMEELICRRRAVLSAWERLCSP